MKKLLIPILSILPLCGTTTREFSDAFHYAKEELAELLNEVEYAAHEAVVGTEEALHDIATIITAYEDSLSVRYLIEQPGTYSSTEALVTNSLDETDSIAQRVAHTEKALTALFPHMNGLPRVGFCGSGGGVRAMYETLGSLSALETLGLLNTVIYASGLSGSTWALNPWVASKLPVNEFTNLLMPKLTQTLTHQVKTMTSDDLYDLLLVLGRAYYNKRELSAIDIYGALTAHLFLRTFVQTPYEFHMTCLQPQIVDGSYPLIISTSVIGGNNIIYDTFGHKPTFEFTPFTSGCHEAECFIPTWAVGRAYAKGSSQTIIPKTLFPEADLLISAGKKLAPTSMELLTELYALIKSYENAPYYGHEVPLGYLMGICGSAFSADLFNALFELYQLLKPGAIDPNLQGPLKLVIEIVQELIEQTIGELGEKLSKGKLTRKDIVHCLKNNQFAAAYMPNIRYQLSTMPFDQLKTITLVDGGFDLMKLDRVNLGIVPLLYRDLDVILICDASADNQGGAALRAAEEVAQLLERPFPKIDYTGIDTTIATLIIDEENLEAPIIVYMPGIANQDYNPTVDPQASCYEAQVFQYPLEQAQNLYGLIEYNTLASAELIKQAYLTASERKIRR